MSSSIGKLFDESNKIRELGNKVSKSLQNYTAARTVIRDYVITVDEDYYAQVEQRLARSTEALAQAEAIVEEGEMRDSIHRLRESILVWGAIARQVRDAFADYQETAQRKVLAHFQALNQVGNTLLQSHGPLIFGMVLDVHSANAAISGYFINGEQQLADNAQHSIDAAREKIRQAEQGNEHLKEALRSFTEHLDAYVHGFREAIAQRKNAYELFQRNLSTLGVQVQNEAEQFHHDIVERQRKTDEQSVTLMMELRHAVEHEELALHYQPKVDLSRDTMNHVEVLVRWIHPERGNVRPDQFIPFAENTGYITEITRYVIDRALRQCAAWHAKGLPINVAVNMSTRDLLDPDLPATIGRLLEANQIDPQWLSLEITESAIMEDPRKSEKVLQALREMGLRLSIDDFGTGYSSLAYLKNFHAQELKIDRAFVMDIDDHKSSTTIIRSIIELGHNMGMKIVAEGVENKATCDLLKAMGCDYIQGYYIGKAMPCDQLEQWLSQSEWNVGRPDDSAWTQPHAA